MIVHVLNAANALNPQSVGIVVGHQREQIQETLASHKVDFIVQEQQNGTAHAVSEFLRAKPEASGSLLVLSGDTPLLTADLLKSLVAEHTQRKAAISLVTTEVQNATGYGRVVRNPNGSVARIVEEADATPEQKKIREINAGIYVFEIEQLRLWLPKVQTDNKQKEYYLPDVIELALRDGRTVFAFRGAEEQVLGVNTRVDLAAVEKAMRLRINEHWMLQGVTLKDPGTTYIDAAVQIGTDAIIYPNVQIEGDTVIGPEVVIHSNCRITNSRIDEGCILYENSSVDSARMESGVKIGPFARVRPDTLLRKGVRIGNFVELKKTTMGEGSKANHLAYLGDATIGSDVNIGAGTITCNYDGVNKYPTIIEDEAFIGSDSQLVAPVKVGKGAYIAAGSSITEDVPAGALGIARSRQINKEGWAAGKRQPQKHKDSKPK